MAASQEIPSDIVFEILTRTKSLKTLYTCKAVSKEWKMMIESSSFSPLYWERTNNFSGYIVQYICRHKCSLTFLCSLIDKSASSIESSRILASCNHGILCGVTRSQYNQRYYVCKPCTKQRINLPNPKLRYRTAGVAILVLESSPFRYKIVRLSHGKDVGSNKKYYKYRCEIFDSKIWRWREIQDLILQYKEDLSDSSAPANTSNTTYWLTTRDNVVAFDEPSSAFRTFSLPKRVIRYDSYESKQLLEHQARLGFACMNRETNYIELWLRDNGEWNKNAAVNVGGLEKRLIWVSPAGSYYDGIKLQAYHDIVLYRLQDYTFSKVKPAHHHRVIGSSLKVFRFQSDSELVHLGRGR